MLLRGSTHGALCTICPYAVNGGPGRAVMSEHPENPLWIIVGDGPGRTEAQLGRPFMGSQQLVERTLAKIGCRRDQLLLTTAVLCTAPVRDFSAPTDEDAERMAAVAACRPRLHAELAQWPGKPVLALGATAARAVIPKATLDAIDPPDVPRSRKRSQKDRQKAERKALEQAAREAERAAKAATKAEEAKVKKIAQLEKQQLTALRNARFTQIKEAARLARKKFTHKQINAQIDEELPRGIAARAVELARLEYDSLVQLREMQLQYEAAHPAPPKPKKHKPAKITDIMGTTLEVDVDGTGKRPLIPTLHPASLLAGGGATIGGTHTPDLAFINLIYDASKAHSLAQGKDIWLRPKVSTEITDPERTWQLLRDIVFQAIEEGEVAIDLETYVDDGERHHALMAYVARIRSIGFAVKDHAVSIMWDVLPGWAQSYVQLVLAHPNVTKVFHNGLYDRTVFAANGFTLDGPWGDTLLQHHAAFPGSAHRLQVVTAQFFAVSPWKSEYRNAEETPEGLTTYNALDTAATRALHPALTIMVKRTNTEKIYALDRKMSEIASKMHLAGMPVSREVNSELLSTFTQNVVESRRAVEAFADDPKLRDEIQHQLALQQAHTVRKGDPGSVEERHVLRLAKLKESGWRWKIGSSKHISSLLLAAGVELLQQTKSNQISTKKDVLEGLVNIPVVRDILIYRENDKLFSTFCLAPGTRVLTADLRWVPIETLKVDDDLIGFDEHGRGKASKKGPGAAYRRSRVEAISQGVLPCYRITTDRGTVTASSDHLWLMRNGTRVGSRRSWTKTEDLVPGDILAALCDPWPEDATWEAGYIAGFLDGEGCVGKHGACFTQNPGVGLDHMMRLLEAKGFGLFVNKKSSQRSVNVFPHGGFPGAMRMIGQFRSPRLLGKADSLWDGKPTGAPSNCAMIVQKIEKLGDHPVIALRTSTRTFIAEGLLTHNCWKMFDRHRDGELIQHGYADEHDRIHPIWSVHKITGRWASSEPVVSNVPKDKWKKLVGDAALPLLGLALPEPGSKFTLPSGAFARVNKDRDKTVSKLMRPNLRAQIRAPKGRVFIGGDFAQIEYRIIALLSGDPHLCRTFAEGRDIHVENARVIWPDFDRLDSVTQKEVRERAKPLGYGAMYLAQVETLHKQLLKDGYNVRLVDVATAITKLLNAMRGVVRWQRETVALASQPPYEIRDIVIGRRRTWPLGQVEGTEAVNFGVQSTAAAIMNQGLARHFESLQKYKQADMIGQFHDAVIVEAWEDDAERIAIDMKRDFEQEIERNGHRIPFLFEPKVGTDWTQV